MPASDTLAQPLRIGGFTARNRAFLAPLSGVTDSAFRKRAYAHGAGLVVSEMIASGELARGRDESNRRVARLDGVPHVVQLAGREASAVAEAARIAEGEGAEIIDFNMGCPAKKVTGGYCGSALMRDPDQAIGLLDAIVAAVAVPVTVKMRLGWDTTCLNAPEIAARAEQAGVAMVTVHGRTREQFYKGEADWSAVRTVRDAIKVPLVVNGDIRNPDDARKALHLSGADAVMVGRAHYGAPWAAGCIARAAGAAHGDDGPAAHDLADYVISHYEAMLGLYGREAGLRHARKHLGWYLERHAAETPLDLRAAIMTATDPEVVIGALRDAFAEAADHRKLAA